MDGKLRLLLAIIVIVVIVVVVMLVLYYNATKTDTKTEAADTKTDVDTTNPIVSPTIVAGSPIPSGRDDYDSEIIITPKPTISSTSTPTPLVAEKIPVLSETRLPPLSAAENPLPSTDIPKALPMSDEAEKFWEGQKDIVNGASSTNPHVTSPGTVKPVIPHLILTNSSTTKQPVSPVIYNEQNPFIYEFDGMQQLDFTGIL
jgi:hypothetical protein